MNRDFEGRRRSRLATLGKLLQLNWSTSAAIDEVFAASSLYLATDQPDAAAKGGKRRDWMNISIFLRNTETHFAVDAAQPY